MVDQEQVVEVVIRQDQPYAGLVRRMESPMSLLIKLDTLFSNRVYFRLYGLGKTQLFIWGMYDRVLDQVIFDGSCRWRLNMLNKAIEYFKTRGIRSVSSQTLNRIDELIMAYRDNPGDQSKVRDIENMRRDYPKLRVLIDWFYHVPEVPVPTEDEVNWLYDRFETETGTDPENQNDADYQDLFDAYLEKLRLKVGGYELTINRTDVDNDVVKYVPRGGRAEVVKLTEKILRKVERSEYVTANLSRYDDCPKLAECEDDPSAPGCGLYFSGDPKRLDELDSLL